ncbi:MAG: terminase small subunit [Flavisolibacter sp.]
MAAPIENQFWKLRESHGREKIFETPEELWKTACEYFQWVDDNPLYEEKVFGSNVTMYPKKRRPYTIAALCYYCQIGESTWKDYKNKYPEYSKVIEAIEQVMYSQKFEGAAVGFFNPAIIARDLGLAEKVESKQEINNNNADLSKLTDDEIKQYIELQRKINE